MQSERRHDEEDRPRQEQDERSKDFATVSPPKYTCTRDGVVPHAFAPYYLQRVTANTRCPECNAKGTLRRA